MHCLVCNPFCGRCKPPKPLPAKCPACGAYNFQQPEKCRVCSAVLPEPPKPVPVMCLYIGEMCANPCQKHKIAVSMKEPVNCPYHTKVAD